MKFFQISGNFSTCFGCFLPANTTNKKSLNYRNFNKPFLCNVQSLETWNFWDRDETWNIRDRDSQNGYRDESRDRDQVSRLHHWLPALQFSREFGLVFCEVAGFFRLAGCFFWACFNWNLLVFWACLIQISLLRIAFFQILWHFCCFHVLLKAHWACFYENLLILGLFFRIFLPALLSNFLADISFCWIFLTTHAGFVFRWNYLFLACFSNLLACFSKITWHHWFCSYRWPEKFWTVTIFVSIFVNLFNRA